MKKERNSNFELLRIFAMLMIVMHHYICHGGFVFDKALTFNKAVSECAYWGGKVGINLFVLITGYFMVKGTWKLSKVLVLYGEILFYSWLISIFFCFNWLGANINSRNNKNGISIFNSKT